MYLSKFAVVNVNILEMNDLNKRAGQKVIGEKKGGLTHPCRPENAI